MSARVPQIRAAVLAALCAAAVGGCAAAPSAPTTQAAAEQSTPQAPSEAATVEETAAEEPASDAAEPATDPVASDPDEPGSSPPASAAAPAPAWLGTRVLTPGPTGYPPPQETPPELRDRRLVTADVLPPPDDDEFSATIDAVPDDVADRSTWAPECPVGLEELRYVTVSFWGFDDRPHTGELLVNAAAAEDLVGVFARLHEARFPIEEMRITRADELDAPPTGDGNNTGSFVCRPTRGSSSWSEHAYGLAVDINPFHNPLAKEGVVLPELATTYVDRTWHRPGMVQPGDVVTEAFTAIGWQWGGDWRSLSDWMHFSHNGR
jgi:hypothetical protein